MAIKSIHDSYTKCKRDGKHRNPAGSQPVGLPAPTARRGARGETLGAAQSSTKNTQQHVRGGRRPPPPPRGRATPNAAEPGAQGRPNRKRASARVRGRARAQGRRRQGRARPAKRRRAQKEKRIPSKARKQEPQRQARHGCRAKPDRATIRGGADNQKSRPAELIRDYLQGLGLRFEEIELLFFRHRIFYFFRLNCSIGQQVKA